MERITNDLNKSGETDPISGGEFNANTLRRRLINAGSQYVQRFRHNGEIQDIRSNILPLLSDEIVSRIKNQLRENKIVTKRGAIYPLAHIVRCEGCGSVLSGAGTKSAKYYRHHGQRVRGNDCVNHVPAERLEQAVLAQIGELLKKNNKLKENVQNAIQHLTAGDDDLDAQILHLEKEESKCEREIKNLVELAARNGTSRGIESGLKTRETARITIRSQLEASRLRKAHQPIPADLGERVRAVVTELTGLNGYQVLGWDRESQQQLALYFLGGPVVKDPRRGVWVKRDTALEQRFGCKAWTYRIEGDLVVGAGAATLTSKGKPGGVQEIDDNVAWQDLRGQLDVNTLTALASRVADKFRNVKRGYIRAK
jgi:hypothetical protein